MRKMLILGMFLPILGTGCAQAPVYRTVDLSCGWLRPLELSDQAIEAMTLDDLYQLNSLNDAIAANCGWKEK
jgi:hypothetical protein